MSVTGFNRRRREIEKEVEEKVNKQKKNTKTKENKETSQKG